MGAFTIVTALAIADLDVASMHLQALAAGAAGNSITIRLINPGVSHVLSIAVVGNHISVTLDHDGMGITTTYGDLVVALQGDGPSAALVQASGGDGATVVALAQTPLAGGANSVISSNAPANTISMLEVGVGGQYEISLIDNFQALLATNLSIITSQPEIFYVPQLTAAEVTHGSDQSISLTVYNNSASGVSLTAGDSILVDLTLRNRSVA